MPAPLTSPLPTERRLTSCVTPRLRTLLALGLAAWLAACSTTAPTPPAGPGGATVPGTVRPGRDGPPTEPGPDPMSVPDAEPRVEPIRNGGPNKPYEVLGQTYVPITSDAPLVERGLASWYGRKFHGKRTASGEVYNMHAMTGAHKTMPIPSYARVTNPANGREVIVRINDRGPFASDRIIDLSWAAAVRLGLQNGVAPVELQRITNDEIRAGLVPRRDPPAAAPTPASPPASPPVTVAAATPTTPARAGAAARPAATRPVRPATGAVAAAPVPPATPATSTSTSTSTSPTPTPTVAAGLPDPVAVALGGTAGLASAPPAALPGVPTPSAPAAPVPVSPPLTASGAGAALAVPGVPPAPASAVATADDKAADKPALQARAGTADAAGFWLQLGAFGRGEGAYQFQRKVSAELDWLAPLLTVFAEGGLHRLQAGPYASRAQAREAGDRIRAALQLVPVIVERR